MSMEKITWTPVVDGTPVAVVGATVLSKSAPGKYEGTFTAASVLKQSFTDSENKPVAFSYVKYINEKQKEIVFTYGMIRKRCGNLPKSMTNPTISKSTKTIGSGKFAEEVAEWSFDAEAFGEALATVDA